MEKGFKITLVLLALICITSCNSSNRINTMESVSGTYFGKYFGGEESFILLKDGTFTQEFTVKDKVSYKLKGTWSLQEDKVTFAPMNYWRPKNGQYIFEKFGTAEGHIFGEGIYFYDDVDYIVYKKN